MTWETSKCDYWQKVQSKENLYEARVCYSRSEHWSFSSNFSCNLSTNLPVCTHSFNWGRSSGLLVSYALCISDALWTEVLSNRAASDIATKRRNRVLTLISVSSYIFIFSFFFFFLLLLLQNYIKNSWVNNNCGEI